MQTERVLIFSHNHPDFSPGGGEIAAYQMFTEIDRRPGHAAIFVGCHSGAHVGGGSYFSMASPAGNDLYLRCQPEYFRFQQKDPVLLLRELPELLRWAAPTVVHFHHYVRPGLEFLRVVRNTLPGVRIVMTLHEYLAICNHNGQMVKTDHGALCHGASPSACAGCFPAIAPTDFFLREQFIKQHFALVDHFIAPSGFLRDRYIAWGIPADRISVIENGQEPAEPLPPRPLTGDEPRSRFAFFGQLSPYKGVDVLLDAAKRLPSGLRAPSGPIRISIFGSNLEAQSADFQQRIHEGLADCADLVQFHGRYRREDLPRLMAGIDWVLMPSIWWENSPLVIQEAFKYRRPMIVSGIGGMAEKVQEGVTGLHVRPGDPQDLADALVRAAADKDLWDRLYAGIQPPPTLEQTVDQVMALYARIGGRAAA